MAAARKIKTRVGKPLQDPYYLQAVDVVSQRLSAGHTPYPKILKELDEIKRDHLDWAEARRLHGEQGKSRLGSHEIALKLDRKNGEIKSWLEGHRPHSLANALSRLSRRKNFVSEAFTPEMAFLTALYNAHHLYPVGKAAGVAIYRQHGQLYAEAIRTFNRMGIHVTQNEVPVVQSTQLTELLDRYTKGRTQTPLNILKSHETIRAYLRGLVLAHGGIKLKNGKGEGRVFHIKALPAFKNAIILFPRLGLMPKFKPGKSGKTVSIIFSGPELEKLEHSRLISREHARELRTFRRREKINRKVRTQHDIETVEAVLKMRSEGKMPKQIADATGVHFELPRLWLKKPPFAAKRLADHYAFAKAIGQPTMHLEQWPLALDLGLRALDRKAKPKIGKRQ